MSLSLRSAEDLMLNMNKVILLTAVTSLSACKDIRETKEYMTGYEEGYLDAINDVCQDWSDALPNEIYYRYEPQICR